MTTDDLAVWLGARYGNYLAAVGRPATYTADGLGPPIDDALLALGYPSSQLASVATTSDGETADLTASASFQTMLQVNRDLGATAINITTPEGAIQLRNMREAAEADLKVCAEILGSRGLSVTGDTTSSGFATWDLNYLGASTWTL